MASIWDKIGGAAAAGTQLAGLNAAQQSAINAGNQANVSAQQIGQTAFEQSQFKPFSVTSGTGSISTSPTGGTTTSLSPQQQQLQQSLFGQQNAMAGYLGGFNPNQFSNLANMGYGGAQGFAGQVQQLDPYMQQQRSQMQGLFGQQLGQVGQPTGFEGVTSQALQLGQQQIGQQAPSDIEALRAQYGGLAGQAGQQLGAFDRAGRETDIYGRLRAMQTPEEERQRMELEQRLFAQGRGGVQTAQYGGTPEQLAMAKAQAEAQNQAGLMAMQQAGTEEQAALAKALGLSGQAGQFAGMSSDLQSAGLERGLGLSRLGMAGSQQQQAQEMARLQQLMALQQGDIGAAGAQQALQQGNLGLAGGMFGLGQQATQSPYQTQALGLQNLLAQLQAGYAPENQLLNQLQAGTNVASIADYGRRFGADQQAEAGMSGLEAMLTGQKTSADLQQAYYNIIAGLLGQQQGGQSGLLGQLFGDKVDINALSELPIFNQSSGKVDIGALSELPIFNQSSGSGSSIENIFTGNLSNYLGGGGNRSSSTSGLLGNAFNISDLFGNSGTPSAKGGTYFGSSAGSSFNPYDYNSLFGPTYDPYANSMFAGGSSSFNEAAGGGSFDSNGNYVPRG
jgi:hypothetical protein